MSNWIPVFGLKQGDGHVPSTRMVLDIVLSVRLSLRESMKNSRLNGDNRATSIGRFIAGEDGGFLFFWMRCGQSGWYSSPEWVKKRMKERTGLRAFQSIYEIRKGERSNLAGNSLGTRLTLDHDSRPCALLECEMSRRGDGKLIWIHVRVNFQLWHTRPLRTLSIAFVLLKIFSKIARDLM